MLCLAALLLAAINNTYFSAVHESVSLNNAACFLKMGSADHRASMRFDRDLQILAAELLSSPFPPSG